MLASGARRVGGPTLWFRDACERYIKYAQIGIETWEFAATDRNIWRQSVQDWYQEGRT